MLEAHCAWRALSLAAASEGMTIDMSAPINEITTSVSMDKAVPIQAGAMREGEFGESSEATKGVQPRV